MANELNELRAKIDAVDSEIVRLSIVVTWSMENAIETADSMKARGYGTKKRTASPYLTPRARTKSSNLCLIQPTTR